MPRHSLSMSKGKSAPLRIPGNIITLYSQITGPKDTKTLRMILDTGASYTMLPYSKTMEIGYNPAASSKRIQIFTVSGTEYVPMIRIASFKCLGIEVKNLAVICHDLPSQSPADGLLGLNFLVHLPSFIRFFASLRLH